MNNVALRRERAEARAQRIREYGNSFIQELTDAYNNDDHLDLGYSTWSEYCATELNGRIALPRVKGDRVEFVKALAESGLSQRAIADATNMSRNTVAKYLNPPVDQIEPPSDDQERISQARERTDQIRAAEAGLNALLQKAHPGITAEDNVAAVLNDRWVIRAIQLESLSPWEVISSASRLNSGERGATIDEQSIDGLVVGLLTRTGRWINGFNPDIPLSETNLYLQENSSHEHHDTR